MSGCSFGDEHAEGGCKGVSTFGGMEWCNGIVEWTTGMVADDHQALIWDIQPMPQSIEVPIAMLQRERSTK